MRSYEAALHTRGFSPIAGVDEAGRGALAGPVVAAAVILGTNTDLSLLKDSKTLNALQRTKALENILSTCTVQTSIISHRLIDKIYILNTTLLAMSFAIKKLPSQCKEIKIDGNKAPKMTGYEIETIIKGDSKLAEISAASIVAKVTRDTIMDKCDKKFPDYLFSQHKGYGTDLHYNLIFKHGICPIHRLSFTLTRQETLF